jgi:hypothetical protein
LVYEFHGFSVFRPGWKSEAVQAMAAPLEVVTDSLFVLGEIIFKFIDGSKAAPRPASNDIP